MGSKKVPLWLIFENADKCASPTEILTLFKSGDDLRQGMLTLQMLNVMGGVWLDSKLNLHSKQYSATGINNDGESVGMLEIVLISTTINTTNDKYGGAFNAQTIDTRYTRYICNGYW